MDNIKKNIVLVVVLSITMLLSAFLLYMVIEKHKAMNLSIQNVEKCLVDIEDLNKATPAPVEKNLEWIREDVAKLEQLVKETRSIFGHPFVEPFREFSKVLSVSEYELQAKFRTYWQREIKKVQNPYTLLSDFLKGYDAVKVEKALGLFKQMVQKQTMDEVNDANVNDFLLEAFGVQRTMTDVKCKSYISESQERLAKMLSPTHQATTQEYGSPAPQPIRRVTLGGGQQSTVSKFSFEDFDGRMPAPEDIPMILKNLRIVEDFSSRLLSSGVKQLNSIKRSSLHGEKEKGYLKFNYTLTVISDMNDIRAFANNLQSAYRENQIYIIKGISLERVIDEAAKIIVEGEKSQPFAATVVDPGKRVREGAPSANTEENLPFHLRKGYGALVLGPGLIKAEIEFDYVCYVGDELVSK
ncbi:MAG: hypothetical protein A2X49_06360 [Lentisphaerae bacterium GWF2_52_8]|nr:MAG: hypothetical protein A2X49_06360 [Lentisphaerae bacterium GWF2_52_8]